jgi:hypothetical protein
MNIWSKSGGDSLAPNNNGRRNQPVRCCRPRKTTLNWVKQLQDELVGKKKVYMFILIFSLIFFFKVAEVPCNVLAAIYCVLNSFVNASHDVFVVVFFVYSKVPRSVPPGGTTSSLLGLSLGWRVPLSVSKLLVGKLRSGTFDGTWAEVPRKFCA